MGWRKIVVEEQEFRWRVGSGCTAVITDGNKSHSVDGPALTGRSWDTIERGQNKKTSDGMILPSHIAKWIAENLLGKDG